MLAYPLPVDKEVKVVGDEDELARLAGCAVRIPLF